MRAEDGLCIRKVPAEGRTDRIGGGVIRMRGGRGKPSSAMAARLWLESGTWMTTPVTRRGRHEGRAGFVQGGGESENSDHDGMNLRCHYDIQ